MSAIARLGLSVTVRRCAATLVTGALLGLSLAGGVSAASPAGLDTTDPRFQGIAEFLAEIGATSADAQAVATATFVDPTRDSVLADGRTASSQPPQTDIIAAVTFQVHSAPEVPSRWLAAGGVFGPDAPDRITRATPAGEPVSGNWTVFAIVTAETPAVPVQGRTQVGVAALIAPPPGQPTLIFQSQQPADPFNNANTAWLVSASNGNPFKLEKVAILTQGGTFQPVPTDAVAIAIGTAVLVMVPQTEGNVRTWRELGQTQTTNLITDLLPEWNRPPQPLAPPGPVVTIAEPAVSEPPVGASASPGESVGPTASQATTQTPGEAGGPSVPGLLGLGIVGLVVIGVGGWFLRRRERRGQPI